MRLSIAIALALPEEAPGASRDLALVGFGEKVVDRRVREPAHPSNLVVAEAGDLQRFDVAATLRQLRKRLQRLAQSEPDRGVVTLVGDVPRVGTALVAGIS